ncbi:MAG: DUF3638 domain-containing protein [Chlamydia sp.]
MSEVNRLLSNNSWIAIHQTSEGAIQKKKDIKIIQQLVQKMSLEDLALLKDTNSFTINNVTYSIERLTTKDLIESSSIEIAKQSPSIFQMIRDAFRALILFLTRSSHSPDRAQKEELQFAMHLFKNLDEELFNEDTFSSLLQESHLPFSSVIGLWNRFLNKSVYFWENSTYKQELISQLKNLEQLEKYQKTCEAIQKIASPNARERKRIALREEIQHQIDVLPENGKLLIPGGYYGPDGSVTMLYEIQRKANSDGYSIRGIDISLETNDLKNGASKNSIDASSVQKKGQKKQSSEFLLELKNGDIADFIDTSTLLLSGKKSIAEMKSEVKLTFSSMLWDVIKKKIGERFFGRDAFKKRHKDTRQNIFHSLLQPSNAVKTHIGLTSKAYESDTPIYLFKTFIKGLPHTAPLDKGSSIQTVQKEVFFEEKLLFRSELLKNILDNSSSAEMKNPLFRAWLRKNCQTILDQLIEIDAHKAKLTLLHSKALESIQKQIFEKLEQLKLYDKEQLFSLPKAPVVTSETQFQQVLHPSTPILPLKSIEKRGAHPLRPLIITQAEACSIVKRGDTAALEKTIDTLKKMANKREFLSLRANLRELFFGFEKSRDLFTKNNPPEKFLESIKEMQFLLTRSAFGLKRFAVSDEDLRMTLLSLELQDRLVRLHYPKDAFAQEYVLSTDDIESIVMKNPLFSLGGSTHAIFESLNYFRHLRNSGKKSARLVLTDPNACRERNFCTGDRDLFLKYSQNKGKDDDELFRINCRTVAIPDPESKEKIKPTLPHHLIHLRQSAAISQVLLAPTRSLFITGKKTITATAKATVEEIGMDFKKLEENGIETAFKIQTHVIYQKLQKNDGEISFSIENSSPFFDHGSQMVLQPWNLALHDMSDPLPVGINTRFDFKHKTFFDKNGVEIPKDAIEKLVDSVVGEDSSQGKEKAYKDDGSISPIASGPRSAPFQEHRVDAQTEHQILQQQIQIMGLPSDLSQQLQLCMTDPKKSRASNLFGFIKRNRVFLNDSKQGPVLHRLLETALFRSDSLFFSTIVGERRVDKKRVAEMAQKIADLAIKMAQEEQLFGVSALFETLLNISKLLPKNNLECRQSIDRIETILDQKSTNSGLAQNQILKVLLLKQAYDFDAAPEQYTAAKKTVKYLFQYKKNIAQKNWINPLHEERIQVLIGQLETSIKSLLKERADRADLFQSLGLNSDLPWESEKNGLIWSSDPYQVDCSQFQVWQDGMRIAPLPYSVTASLSFTDFDHIIRGSDPTCNPSHENWSSKLIQIKNKKEPPCEALQYDITTKNGAAKFRIIESQDGLIRFYRMSSSQSKKWQQYIPDFTFPQKSEEGQSNPVPRIFRGNSIWIEDDNTFFVIEDGAKPIWSGNLRQSKDGYNIDSIESAQKKSKAYNWKGLKTSLFSALDDLSYIVTTGKSGSISSVAYERLGIEYTWDKRSKKWNSAQFPGYFLSDKSIEHFSQPGPQYPNLSRLRTSRFKNFQGLFAPTFVNYHLLESKKGHKNPILLLPGVQIAKANKNSKIEYRFPPEWESRIEDSQQLFQYKLDPRDGLKADKEPEGYLYLAYSLMSQDNLKDAFFYLSKASTAKKLSKTGETILRWCTDSLKKIEQSPEKDAFTLRVELLKLSYEAALGSDVISPDLGFHKRCLDLFNLKISYELAKREGKVEAVLLTDEELASIDAISGRSLAPLAQKIQEHQELFTYAFNLFDEKIISKSSSPIDGNFSEFDSREMDQDMRALLENVKTARAEIKEANTHLESIHEIINDPKIQALQKEVLDPLQISLMELEEWNKAGVFDSVDMHSDDVYEKIIDFEKRHLIKYRGKLRSNIRSLEKQLEERSLESKNRPVRDIDLGDNKTTKLFSSHNSGPLSCFTTLSPSIQVDIAVSQASIIDRVFPSKPTLSDPYAVEVRNGLKKDLKAYIEQSQSAQSSKEAPSIISKKMDELESSLHSLRLVFEGESAQLKEDILHFFEKEQIAASPLQTLKIFFKKPGLESKDALFATILRSFGERDLTTLEMLYGKKVESYQEIEGKIRAFLMASIQETQLQTACTLLEQIKMLGSSNSAQLKTEELHKILNAEWQYDVDQDPFAPTILLLEYELGFVCRDSQIKVVRESLSKENLFKQEICGGGKTTVLRNLISHLKADGVHLSGVSTLSAMRQEHGTLFDRTTKNAFKQTVFSFRFSRSTPSDEASLLKLHETLLLITLHRGRIDLSKNDLQSLLSLTRLKQDEAAKKMRIFLSQNSPDEAYSASLRKEIQKLYAEIGVMEDIQSLLMKRAVITADELDKDTDIKEELNFAIGAAKSIAEEQREGLLSIFAEIFKERRLEKLAKAICDNRVQELDVRERGAMLDILAEIFAQRVLHHENPQSLLFASCSKEDIAHYLRNSDFTSSVKVYDICKNHTENSSIKELLYQQNFLSTLLPDAFSKRGGVDYGRAENGTSVIPFAGSDKPKERSGHGNLGEKLMYTALNYLDLTSTGGITEDQIRFELNKARQIAFNEYSNRIELGSIPNFSVDDAAAAKEFCKKFGFQIPFSQIKEEHFQATIKALSLNKEELLKFIRSSIFPDIRIYDEKIVSDAQDPVSMVLSYSGSSGTDMTIYSMPDLIDVSDARQVGVHGEVFYALAESAEKQENSFISLKESSQESLTKILASEMKWGDCLSDVGCLYPGVAAQEIASQLFQAIKERFPNCEKDYPKYIWFMDRCDSWKMLASDGSIEDIDLSIDPKDKITIFDDVHTRGAERPSTDNVVEFVTISPTTCLSQFEQGVMRERGVTKGKATVRYILSPAVATKMGETPTLAHLLDHVVENEVKISLKPRNMKAQPQKIKHILKNRINRAGLKMRGICRSFPPSDTYYKLRELIHEETRSCLFFSNAISAEQAGAPSQQESSIGYFDKIVLSEIEKLKALTDPNGSLSMRSQESNLNLVPAPITKQQFFDVIDPFLTWGSETKKELDKNDLLLDKKEVQEIKETIDLIEKMVENVRKFPSTIEHAHPFDYADTLQKIGQQLDSLPEDSFYPEAFKQYSASMNALLKPLLEIFQEELVLAEVQLVAKLSDGERSSYLEREKRSPEFIGRVQNECTLGRGQIDAKYIEEKIYAGQIDLGMEQEVQVEVEMEVQVEVQTEANQEESLNASDSGLNVYTHIPIPQNAIGVPKYGHFHAFQDPKMPKVLQSERKLYTENFSPTNRTDKKQTPWSHYVNPIQKTLFYITDSSVQELIGSRLDIDRTFQPYVSISQYSTSSLAWIQDYSSGIVPKEIRERLTEEQKRIVMQEMVKTKLMNLDLYFPSAQKNIEEKGDPILSGYYENLIFFLEKECRDDQSLASLEKAISSKIVQERPSSIYRGSDVERAFATVHAKYSNAHKPTGNI